MKKRIYSLFLLLLLLPVVISCSNRGNSTKTGTSTVDSIEPTVEIRPEINKVSKYAKMEEEACFNFFFETQVTKEGKAYGLIPDRYPDNGLASIASVGFGLAAIPIGINSGYITYEEGLNRAKLTLLSMKELERVEGFYYHFYALRNGNPATNSEISNIDSAIFIIGALACGEYFGGEVKDIAYSIYDEMNWSWFINPKNDLFYMGFDEKRGGFGAWDFYGEQLMMYFLGAGSQTHPTGKKHYDRIVKHIGIYDGISYIHSWFDSIFTYQFSHSFIDFRNLVDANGINWFNNSVNASKVHLKYCTNNPDGFLAYNDSSWGLTACDTPKGYSGKLGGPVNGYDNRQTRNDGTVALCGSIGSMPFLPNEVNKSINYYYELLDGRLVGKYGLYDSYNLENNRVWIAKDVIGIDKGVSLLMINNYRTGLIWNLINNADFMKKAIEVLEFRYI